MVIRQVGSVAKRPEGTGCRAQPCEIDWKETEQHDRPGGRYCGAECWGAAPRRLRRNAGCRAHLGRVALGERRDASRTDRSAIRFGVYDDPPGKERKPDQKHGECCE